MREPAIGLSTHAFRDFKSRLQATSPLRLEADTKESRYQSDKGGLFKTSNDARKLTQDCCLTMSPSAGRDPPHRHEYCSRRGAIA